MFVLILMLSAMLETASITKRSYSDQSVRGYITEVSISKLQSVCVVNFEALINKTCCREHVGGMKFARKSSKHYFDVNALRGLTVAAQDDIIMQYAR